MGQVSLAVNFFVALFALLDPIGCVPVFAAATAGASPAGRRLTAAYIAIFSFFFHSFFYVTGLSLLQFFGISLPAFRIAGGVLLFLLGLSMVRGEFAGPVAALADETPLSTRAYARERFEQMVVPFAMPLLIGPGAISTVVIFAGEARRMGVAGFGGGLVAIAAVSLSVLVVFWFTSLISRILGRIGMTIIVRVLGLILCALAVQFLIGGLAAATTGLIRPDAATPYPSKP
jgi:multiple antibiotic resistance protein